MSDEDSPPEGSPPDESLADAELDTVVGGVGCTYHPGQSGTHYYVQGSQTFQCSGSGWVLKP